MSGVEESKECRIEDPGTISQWKENLYKSRLISEEDETILIQHPLNFFCDEDNESESNHLIYIQTCPTKFFIYNCLKAIDIAQKKDFSSAKALVRKLECYLDMYPMDIEEFYDVKGFYHLLYSTLADILILELRDVEEGGDAQNLDTPTDWDLDWDSLSCKGKSVIFGAKLYYWLLVGESLKNLSRLASQILSLSNDIPEWHYLFCKVKRKRRLDTNLIIVQPKKAELDSLRKALALQPSNLLIWTMMIEILFDCIRTDERILSLDILGIKFTSIHRLTLFMHCEIQQIVKIPGIPKFCWFEINVIACRFYNYKNLPEMTMFNDRNELVVLLSREQAKQLSVTYFENALQIDPASEDVTLIEAFDRLKLFDREKALGALERALKVDPLNYNINVIYLRILVGDKEQHDHAVGDITKCLLNAKRHKWPLLAQVHLHFLRGCIFWIKGLLNECVRDWIDGLYLHDVYFLNQFSYWTKTKVRKYLWPDEFNNFQVVEVLKDILRNLAKLENEADKRIPGAATAFLVEIEDLFPLNSTISKELRILSKKWYYLLEAHLSDDSQSDDTDVEDGGENMEDEGENVEDEGEKIEDEGENIEDGGDNVMESTMTIQVEEPEVIELSGDDDDEIHTSSTVPKKSEEEEGPFNRLNTFLSNPFFQLQSET